MTEARQDTLLQLPRIIITGLEHVAAVIRFDDDRGTASQAFADECCDVSEVHHRGNLYALVSCRETKVVYGVVRDSERMKINLADAKVFARLDLLYSIAQCFRPAARFVVADVLFFTDVCVKRFRGDINRTI